jgi:hypothetical protein
VYRTKQRCVEDGLDRALTEMPRPGAPRKLGATDEALLVAVACSQPPGGRARWTMDLLAGEVVRLTAHETLSGDTVGRRLAEMQLKPWQEKMWCIPQVNAEYVARMEDVLDLYAAPPDPRRPVVGFDETPRQLIGGRAGPDSAVATRQGHRPPDVRGFCRLHVGGQIIEDHADPARVSLHAETRQLAQHGRDRDRRDGLAVPRSTDPGQGDTTLILASSLTPTTGCDPGALGPALAALSGCGGREGRRKPTRYRPSGLVGFPPIRASTQRSLTRMTTTPDGTSPYIPSTMNPHVRTSYDSWFRFVLRRTTKADTTYAVWRARAVVAVSSAGGRSEHGATPRSRKSGAAIKNPLELQPRRSRSSRRTRIR